MYLDSIGVGVTQHTERPRIQKIHNDNVYWWNWRKADLSNLFQKFYRCDRLVLWNWDLPIWSRHYCKDSYCNQFLWSCGNKRWIDLLCGVGVVKFSPLNSDIYGCLADGKVTWDRLYFKWTTAILPDHWDRKSGVCHCWLCTVNIQFFINYNTIVNKM